MLGGTCLNHGCDPTKTLLHIASDYYTAQHDSRLGLYVCDARLDWSEVREFVQDQGVRYRVARMSFEQSERAITLGKTEGMVKLLLDEQHRLLGAHILAERGDDLLAPLVLTMLAQLPIDALSSTLMPYPTLSETIAKVAGKREYP